MTGPGVRPELLAFRFVYNELVKAEGALVNAQAATDDKLVADAIQRARTAMLPARRRAKELLADADVRTAPQPDLLDQPEEG